MVPVVGAIGLFTFLSIATYYEEQRKMREADLQLQFKKTLLEKYNDPESVRQVLELEDRRTRQRDAEKRVLAGTIVSAIGVALVIGMYLMVGSPRLTLPGLILLGVGLALIFYPQIAQQLSATGHRS